MSEFQSAAIDNTVRELPRPQGYLWPEPPKEAKDTLPKNFGWPATRPATARLLRACSSVTSTSNSKGIEGSVPKGAGLFACPLQSCFCHEALLPPHRQVCSVTTLQSQHDIPAIFYKHYPSFASGQMNVSELARICGLSRPTVYKYLKIVA